MSWCVSHHYSATWYASLRGGWGSVWLATRGSNPECGSQSPMCYRLHQSPMLVGGAGVAPAVFLTSRIYSPLPSLLGTPSNIYRPEKISHICQLVLLSSLSEFGFRPWVEISFSTGGEIRAGGSCFLSELPLLQPNPLTATSPYGACRLATCR